MFTIKITTEKEVEQICQALSEYSRTKLDQITRLLDYFSLKKLRTTAANSKDIAKQNEILHNMVDVYIELKKANERGNSPDYDAMKEKLLNKIH